MRESGFAVKQKWTLHSYIISVILCGYVKRINNLLR